MFQKILLSIVLFFAFSIVAFFLLIKVIDFNEYKPRIQKAIKESTGYELIIRGDITLSLSPAGVSIFDIEVINPHYRSETPFAKLGSFDVALDLPALLKKQIKVKHIALDGLNLIIEKNKEGKFNYELASVAKTADKKAKENNTTSIKEDTFPLVNVKNLKFSNANITYSEVAKNTQILFEKINFDMNDISYDAAKRTLQSLSFTGYTHIDKVQYAGYMLSDITMPLEMKEAIVLSENVTYTLFDTPFQGISKFDLSGKQPKISLKSKVSGLKLANFSKGIWNQELLEGTANGDFKLSFYVGDIHTFKSTLTGFIHLYGTDVTLKGYDVDKIASALDTKAKGFNFNTLTAAFKGGDTLLKEITTNMDMGYSEIKLSDVALSTATNRVAMKGAINSVEEKLMDLRVALLDEKGCATFEQKFSGTFTKPSLKINEGTVTALHNVAVSFSTNAKKPSNTIKKNDENCTIFYEGIIKHPQFNPPSATPSGE